MKFISTTNGDCLIAIGDCGEIEAWPRGWVVRIYLLCGCIMLLNVTIDEGSNVACSTAGLICGLGEAQSTEQLIKNLDRFLIFGLCVGRVVRHGIHNVD